MQKKAIEGIVAQSNPNFFDGLQPRKTLRHKIMLMYSLILHCLSSYKQRFGYNAHRENTRKVIMFLSSPFAW